MRRALVTILAVPALLLAGCSDDGGADAPTPASSTAADVVEETSDATTAPDTDSTTTTADAAATSPGDGAAGTGEPADGEVEGGAEGEAAAQVATDFLVAMISADPEACDHMVSFTDLEKPMAEVEDDYDACVTLLPEVLQPELEAQGLDNADPGVLEAVTIRGADVAEDGESAVVDEDNFTDLFAESMDGESLSLRKIEDRWYVDLDASFQPADQGR